MNCETVRSRMEEAFDGELNDAQSRELGEHVSGCASCEAEWQDLEKLESALRGAVQNRGARVPNRLAGRNTGVPRLLPFAAAFLFAGLIWFVMQEPVRPGLGALLSAYARADEPAERSRIQMKIHAMGEAALREILRALDDPSIRVQIGASQILATYKGELVRRRVLDYQKQRGAAVAEEDWTLDELGMESSDEELIQVVFAWVEQEDSPDRAVDVLRKLDRSGLNAGVRKRIVEHLVELLKNSDPRVQKLALSLVQALEIDFPVPILVEFLEEPELGPPALRVLRRVTGEDFGADKKSWEQYWASQSRM